MISSLILLLLIIGSNVDVLVAVCAELFALTDLGIVGTVLAMIGARWWVES